MSSLEKIADILKHGEERERKYETFTEINKRISLLKEETNRNGIKYAEKQEEWYLLKKKFYELQVNVEIANRRIASLESICRDIEGECNREKNNYYETYDALVTNCQDFLERGNNVLYEIERYNNVTENRTSQISKKEYVKEERKRKLQELKKQGESEGGGFFELAKKHKMEQIKRFLKSR